MWQVLLVEDEPYVRRSIRNAIPWESFGFTIAAEADDGEEALEYMVEHHVDVVISDIRMPFMDGIELLQIAKERSYPAKFVMLTCVNEFEYARQAIKHGASGYVLKLSMDDEELQTILGKIGAELTRKREGELAAALSPLYANLWKWIHGKDDGEERDLFLSAMASCSLPAHLQIFGCVGQDGVLRMKQMVTQSPLQGNGSDGSQRIVHTFEANGIASLFLWSDTPIRMDPELGLELERPALDSSRGASAIAGSPVLPGRRLPEGWTAVLSELSRGWYGSRRTEQGLFLLGTAGESARLPEIIPLSWKEERGVIQHFEQMQWAECKSALQTVWESMRERAVPVMLVRETAERLDKWFARITGTGSHWTPAEAVVRAITHDGLLQALCDRIDEYSRNRMTHAVTDHPEINKIMDYVAKHYDKNLTLKAMAKYVNMDEQYLSGLFKKKTGEQFIQYVQRIRIEQARFYLRETDLVVADICERVGFAHMNYFLKVFRKWTDQSPNEYRMAHKAERS